MGQKKRPHLWLEVLKDVGFLELHLICLVILSLSSGGRVINARIPCNYASAKMTLSIMIDRITELCTLSKSKGTRSQVSNDIPPSEVGQGQTFASKQNLKHFTSTQFSCVNF